MKRRYIICILAALCLLATAAPLYAASVPEGFAGLKWGSSRNQITAKMNDLGWKQLSGRNPDEAIFRGAFDGNSCELHFVMAGNCLVRGYAMPIARYPEQNVTATRYKYQSIVEHLTAKYGPPTDSGEGPGIAMSTWEFGDGVTTDKYKIEVMFNKSGTWFSDVDGLYTYIQVEYTAVSMEERLNNQNL